MKAVVVRAYGGPEMLKLESWPDPVAVNGQLLVRVAAAGVNPIDWKLRSGVMKEIMPVSFPMVPGYDFSGVVEAVGSAVNGFAVGDKVFGRSEGSYAEQIAADVAGTAKLPAHLDLVESAALPLVSNTGEQLILGTKIQSGQTVVVTGALGAVGRVAVWAARRAGAVVIAAVRGAQVHLADALGASQVIALDNPISLNALQPVDAVADAVGGKVGETMLGKVKPGGVFVTVVGPPANAKLFPTVKVEMVRSWADAASVRRVGEEVAAGRLSVPIARMFPLADAAEAHATAEKGGSAKILLIP